MDPNERMDEPSVSHIPEENIPEAAQEEIPESRETVPQPDSTGAYHGAGVGQKESPFAASPYYTARQTREPGYNGPAWEPGQKNTYQSPYQEPQYQSSDQSAPPKSKKPRRKITGKGRGILAAILALVVVAGSCGITAALVNEHWEREMDELEDSMEQRIERLEDQLEELPGQNIVSGNSVSKL